MKEKLSVTEKRAKQFCNDLCIRKGGSVQVEWKRSQMWGMNPTIDYGGKCTSVSGCGYDKLSAALATCLRFLFPEGTAPYSEVWGTSGAGESSTMGVLAKYGWTLRKVASGKTFDAYELTRSSTEA